MSVCDATKCVTHSCLIITPPRTSIPNDNDNEDQETFHNISTTSSFRGSGVVGGPPSLEQEAVPPIGVVVPPVPPPPPAPPPPPLLLLCDDDDGDDKLWTGRIVNATTYTCCPSDYDDYPVDVLAGCSTDACISPNSNGGYDCFADGFIHPMVCDATTTTTTSTSPPYRYPRKAAGNIYHPYLCCTTRAANNADVALLIASSIWTVLSLCTCITCLIFILAILRCRLTRSQGYNLYLVFLAAPDLLFNLCSLVRNVVNLSGSQLSRSLGGVVHAVEWFHTAANLWLNALIVQQVYQLLHKSRQCTRTKPPSVRAVCRQATAIYGLASAWAAWSVVLLWHGRTLFRTVHDTAVAWIVSKTIMCGPPFLYVVTICTLVWIRKMLPAHGKTRVLSIYFLRVVIVFMLTWVPFLILVDFTYYHTFQSWMLGLAYYFASLQGLVSVTVATLGKPDIKRAVVRCLQCRRHVDDNNENLDASDGGGGGSNNSMWRMMMPTDSQRASLRLLTRHFSFSPDDGDNNSSSRRSSVQDDLSRRRLSVAKEEEDDENDVLKECGTRNVTTTSHVVRQRHISTSGQKVNIGNEIGAGHCLEEEPNSISLVQEASSYDDVDAIDDLNDEGRFTQSPPPSPKHSSVETSVPSLVVLSKSPNHDDSSH